MITLEDRKILKQTFLFAMNKGVQLYIVGGYLRDFFLKRKKDNPDIDFCISGGAINFGRALAKKMQAGFVVLDKKHGACRIVKKIKDRIYTLDFTDFRGKDLNQDLLHRDFTINTLALRLEDAFGTPAFATLIDLYGARRDLKLKVIRSVNNEVFKGDPLRILRAFSFSLMFGFKIEENTLRLIKSNKKLLGNVSYERIRDELFKIISQDYSCGCLASLDNLGILNLVMPEIEVMRGVNQGPYHHLDVLKHSFETLRQLENLMLKQKTNKEINTYLDEIISSDRKRRALVKLGALLHDIGKPRAKRRRNKKTIFHGHERIGADIAIEICRRLKLSNDEINSLRKMVFWHLRPGYLADNQDISPRAIFRYFRDAAQEGISILLLSIADQRATKGRLTSKESRLQHEKVVFGLIRKYFKKQKEKKIPRLLNGNDLIKKFKLHPSPLIGEILERMEELQAINKIKTKAEAFAEAKKIIIKKPA